MLGGVGRMHLRGCALGAILASRDLYRPRHNMCTIWGCPGTWPRKGIYALCMTCRYDTISRQATCTHRGVPVIGSIPSNPRHNDVHIIWGAMQHPQQYTICYCQQEQVSCELALCQGMPVGGEEVVPQDTFADEDASSPINK
jgi:hypothetical protein